MNRDVVLGLIVLIIVAAGALYVVRDNPTQSLVSPTQTNETAVRAQVTGFGGVLKNVSLLAPDASQEIANTYAPYVAQGLLNTWEASTTQAPGRLTSSPWPDHIDVVSLSPEPDGSYQVQGNLIEATSADQPGQPAASVPVTLMLQNYAGMWLIAAYQAPAEP